MPLIGVGDDGIGNVAAGRHHVKEEMPVSPSAVDTLEVRLGLGPLLSRSDIAHHTQVFAAGRHRLRQRLTAGGNAQQCHVRLHRLGDGQRRLQRALGQW